MNHRTFARPALLALTLVSTTVRAEEAGDADVADLDLVRLLNVEVSTATKTAETIEEAPAVITVITKDDIRRWGYQSVGEMLNHTVGFYLIDDHILPNAGVRGMTGGLGAESGVVKVMIDGRSVAYRTTSGNWLGVELVPLSSVEQVEIIRGPASALYGADAFLGVVNIITSSPNAMRPIRARAAVGLTETNPAGSIDVAGGGKVGPLHLMLGFAGEHDDRTGLALPAESPAPTLPGYVGGRRVTNNLVRNSGVLQSKLGYYADGGRVELSAYASGLERGGDFAHWAQLTNYTDPQGREYGTTVALHQLRVNLDALYQATDSLAFAVQSTFSQGGVLPADRVEVGSNLFYVERQQSYRGIDSMLEARFIPSTSFNLIGGVEVLYDHEKLDPPERVNRVTGESFGGATVGKTADLFNFGAYGSANLKVIDQYLKLTGGLRYDAHSEYGSELSGRVGTTSRWTRTLVSKLLYGEAFKAPSPYLLYAEPLRPGDVVGNPSLAPQRIRTIEYQMSYNPLTVFGVTSSISNSWLRNKAEFTPQGINQTARNVASQQSLAWETRADLRYYDDVNAYGSFDLVRSTRDLGQEGYAATLVGDENVVYPAMIARGGAAFAVPSPPDLPLELGAEGMWVGPRRAADTSIVENGAEFNLPPYLLLNVSLSTRELYLIPGHETRVALRAKNLLVARGPDPGFSGFEYPIEPARIFLEVEHVY